MEEKREAVTMNAKRARFVAEYVVDHNATQAAIRAGYSPHTAKVQGSRLLTFADVDQAIAERGQKQLAKLEITADDIVREAWSIATDAKVSAAARVSALSLLAKRHVEFSEKFERIETAIVREAEQLASELGMDPERAVAQVEAWLQQHGR